MNEYTKEKLGGLALFGRMVARPGKREELMRFLEEATATAAGIEGPAAPLTVILHISPANPDMVVLYEHYASRAAFEEHLANHERIPAYRAMLLRSNELQARPFEMVEVVQPAASFTRSDSAAREERESHPGRYRREARGGVAFIARFPGREGKRSDLLPLFDEAAAHQAEHEPGGALTAIIHTSPAQPDAIVVYEHYPSQSSLDDHRAKLAGYGPYQDLRRRLGEMLAGPPELIELAHPVVRFTRAAVRKE